MKHAEYQLLDTDQTTLYAQVLRPEGEPRAVIIVLHGAAEHGGRYEAFARRFVAHGYAVAAIDHYGHGQSEGQKGFVLAFDSYLDGAGLLLDKCDTLFGSTPKFLLGHSMGGLIACNFLLREQSRFVGCILSGAAISTELTPPAWQMALIKLFSRFVPKLGILQLDASGVSRDPAEVQRYRNDPLVYTGKLSARFVEQLFAGMQAITGSAHEIGLPMLILHGGADSMTAPAGSQFLYERISSEDKTLQIYPGLYHEIFNEPEKEQVLGDIERWLEERLSA